MARRLTYIPNRVIDTNGISDGASIYVYRTGTTTLVSLYSNESLTTPVPNPYVVPAGAAVPEIYHDHSGNIRVRIIAQSGAIISDDDPYQAPVTDIDLASTDIGKGAALVAFQQDIAGAATRTLLDKNRDTLSVTDWPGVVADGTTDNTAAILDFWTALGSTWAGTVHIPYNVKFNFSTIADAAPIRANIVDDSGINGWNTSGWRQKIVGVWESGDPTSVVDLNYIISSGHHPSMILENRGTSGSTSGNERLASILWSSGRFQQGQPGYRGMGRLVFGKSQFDSDRWNLALRKFVTYNARDYEIWAAGRVFAAGAYTVTAGRTYTTVAGGTAGATQPTHTAGTVSDGGIDWTFVEASQDSFLFGVDELGRTSWNTGPTGGAHFKWKQSANDTGNVSVAFESTGVSRAVSLLLQGTDAGGSVNTATPIIQAHPGGTLQIIGGGNVLADISTSSITLGAVGRRASTITNGDTTPSVANLGEITFLNAGATTVTAFDDGAASQELFVLFANGNTTIQHSGSIRLNGAVNVNPATGSTMLFKKFASSGSWYEVGRSF